jgi:hypothetical protein
MSSDDRHGQQEQPQRRRHPLAEQRDHPDRKGDGRSPRGSPQPRGQSGLASRDREVEPARETAIPAAAASIGSRRARASASRPVLISRFTSRPTTKKNHRHQGVVDPRVRRLERRDRRPRQRRVEQPVIGAGEGRVGDSDGRAAASPMSSRPATASPATDSANELFARATMLCLAMNVLIQMGCNSRNRAAFCSFHSSLCL